jgi:hypothetical protein
MGAGERGRCGTCRHFEDWPAAIERGLPGIAALSSAHAASRADDGFCQRHDRYLPATAGCPWYTDDRGKENRDPQMTQIAAGQRIL